MNLALETKIGLFAKGEWQSLVIGKNRYTNLDWLDFGTTFECHQ